MKRGVAGSGASGPGNWPTFERVLDELERSGDGAKGLGARAFATFAAPIDVGREGAASPERWNRALDWIGDPLDFAVARSAATLSDNPESIAAELGLARALTGEQLKRARRRFMWENHPDRRLDAPSDLANRRVAIANMLIDRAEDALRKDGAA